MNTCFKQLLDRNYRHFYVLLRFFHHRNAVAITVFRGTDATLVRCVYLYSWRCRTSVNIIAQTYFYCNTKTQVFTVFLHLHLFSRTEASSPLPLTDTTRKIRGRQSNKDRIFPEAFDLMPRNYDIIGSADSENPVASDDKERQNPSVLLIKFKIRGISQSCSVTKIDDLKPSQVCRTASFHGPSPPHH